MKPTSELKTLIFHLYPAIGAELVWQWHLDVIKKNRNLFDRILISSVHGNNLADPDEVRGLLPKGTEYRHYDNDPALGEMVTINDQIESALNSPGWTLRAHSKAASHPADRLRIYWAAGMWASSVTHLPMEKAEYHISGPMRIDWAKGVCPGDGVPGRSGWFFAGSFFWMRNSELAVREYRMQSPTKWSIEVLPSAVFSISESHCCFLPDLNARYRSMKSWHGDIARQSLSFATRIGISLP